MQQLNDIIKNIITFFTDPSGQPNKNRLLIAGVVFVTGIWLFSPSTEEQPKQMQMQMDMSQQKHMTSFGPGDGYHMHKPVDAARFERIADIRRSADDLPSPLYRNTPKTVETNLDATGVIADIAPVTSYTGPSTILCPGHSPGSVSEIP